MESERADRLYRQLIIGLTAIGAVWRIAMLVSKWGVPLRLNDSFFYSFQARQNAQGHWFQPVFEVSAAEHAPLTSLVLTPGSLLPRYEFWQRATMTLIGIANVPLIAVLGRKVGGRRVGVIAAAIAVVYANFWLGDALIMSESLTILLVTLVMIVALRHSERFTIASAALCGLLLGLGGLARSELLLLVPLFALIGVRTRPVAAWLGRAGLLVLVAAVVIAPWMIYNTSRYDGFVLMSTNDGTTLLGANCPATYGGPALGGWVLTCLANESGDPKHDDPARLSSERRVDAINYAREHLGRVPLVVAARLLRAADLYGLDNLVTADVGEERPAWGVWAGIVCWWLLAPLAVVGWWRTRRTTGPIIAAPVLGVIVTTIVFYGSHRLRVPMEPSVVVGAAITLAWLAAMPQRTRAETR